MKATLIACILKNNQVKIHKFFVKNLIESIVIFVMFTSCSWTQTSKPAKIGIHTICALDSSTIPHTHFFDQQHSLTFRRKKHIPQELQGKGVTLGMNFWTTPWSFPKPPRKKMTHIKDIRSHILVSGFLRNRFLTINSVF